MTPEKTDHQRIIDLEEALKKIPDADTIAHIVRNTMREVLFTTGKGTKAVIISTAVIIGALGIILGGAKIILGFFGFQYLGKF